MQQGEQRFVGPLDDPNRYALWATIGGGGEGVVFRGTRTLADGGSIGVAVKRYNLARFGLSERLDAFVRRLQGQVARLQQFNHPGIAPVHDAFAGPAPHQRGHYDTTNLSPYMVMGYIDGDELNEWIEDEPKASRRLRVLEDAAAALDDVHRHGVVHADIKPSNIRVSKLQLPDGTHLPLAVLVDFGLLRSVTGVAPSQVVGSPGYLAPELYNGGAYSPVSDLYAFAATAAFAFTGKAPTSRDQILAECKESGLPTAGLDVLAAGLDPDPVQRQKALDRGVAGWLSRLRGSVPTTTVSTAIRVGGPPSVAGGPPLVAGGPGTSVGAPTTVSFSEPKQTNTRVLTLAAVALILTLAVVALAWRPWVRGDSGNSADLALSPTASPSQVSSTTQMSTTTTTQVSTTVPAVTTFATTSPPPTSFTTPQTAVPRITSPSAQTPTAPTRVRLLDNSGRMVEKSGMYVESEVDINGVAARPGVETCCYSSVQDSFIDFDLSRSFSTLTARVGVTDDSKATGTSRIQVIADGSVIFDQTFALGQSEDLELDVAGVLRVRFLFTGPGGTVKGAIGDPVVIA